MTTYYFSTSGNNTNDGLSPSSPKQNLSTSDGAQSTTFKAILATGGHSLLFKRGDTWELDVDAWRFGANNGDYNTISAYGTGANPILPRIALYTEASANNYIFSDVEIKYTPVSPVNHCAYISAKNISFINTTFNQLNAKIGNAGGSDNALVYNTKNISFDNCFFYRGAQAGITLFNSHNCEIKNSTFIDCRVNGILAYEGSSFNKIHHNTVSSVEPSEGASIELNWGSTKYNEVYNNYITGENIGIILSGTNNNVYNNIFNNCKVNLLLNGGLLSRGMDCYKNKFFNNTCFCNNSEGLNIFLNNDLVTSAYDNLICNNIFYKNNNYQIQIHYNVIDTDPLENVLFFNNSYWTSDDDFRWYDARISDDFSGFENWQLLGYDLDSKFENVNFKDFTDFNCYVNSNVIKRAIPFRNLTNTDYNDNLRVDKWDIGAVQHNYKSGVYRGNIKVNKVSLK